MQQVVFETDLDNQVYCQVCHVLDSQVQVSHVLDSQVLTAG